MTDVLADMQARLLELKRQAALDFARGAFPNFVLWARQGYQMKWYHRLLAQALDRIQRGTLKRLIVNMPPRHGKQLADSTIVPTPEKDHHIGFDVRWRRHGDLKQGDWVLGSDGEPAEVVAVSPPSMATRLVTINDGEWSFVCHSNHEWVVQARHELSPEVIETEQMWAQILAGIRFTLPATPYNPRRRYDVTSVEPCEPEVGRCIQVDRDDGIYLVGAAFLPTHNSELVSRCFPAYLLGKNPDMRVISTSYNAELASMMNRDVQRIIDSPGYRELFPDTTLAAVNSRSVAGKALRNSDIFEVVGHLGSYRSAGVGGAITGMGGDVLLVDDPCKNEEEARSITYRQKVWEWYTNTLLTRQQHNAAMVACMTRWHDDDLVGRILQRAAEDPKADQWEVICFPSIREDDTNPDDPRAIGEALWPELYDLDLLEKMRASMGEHGFAGLYQQRPSMAGGGTLKEHLWCYWYTSEIEPPPVMARDESGVLVRCKQSRLPAKFDIIYQSWDMAFKDTARSDFVVGQAQAKLAANAYLLDQIRGRMAFSDSVNAVRQLSLRWARSRAKLVEDKANGPAVINTLKREIHGLIAVNPEGGKEARCNSIAPLQAAGNLYIPHPNEATWVRGFVQECAQFPKGKHDDQVDAFTQGINWAYNTRKRRSGKVRVAENIW